MSTRHLIGAAAALVIGGAPNYVFASDASSDAAAPGSGAQGPTQVEVIVVTAEKREQNVNDVPASVIAISGDEMKMRGIVDTASLVRVVSGLTAAVGDQGNPVYTLRGVGFQSLQGSATPAVSVYLDEAPLVYPIMTVGATIDMQRVEVLKGPQGTLFGQNATGGSINYIANKPTDTFEGGIEGSIGRFNTIDVNGYLSGPVSDTLKTRFAFDYLRGDDWQYDYTRSNPSNPTAGHPDRISGRWITEWTPDDRVKVSLNLNGWDDRGDLQFPQYYKTSLISPGGVSAIPFNYPSPPHNDQAVAFTPIELTLPGRPDVPLDLRKHNYFYQAILRADVEISDQLNLVSITQYSRLHRRGSQDVDATDIAGTYAGVSGSEHAFSTELRLEGTGLTDRLNYITGVDYQDDGNDELLFQDIVGQVSSLPPLLPFVIYSTNNASNKTFGIFGNADYKITDRLTVTGGIRYTHVDHHGAGCTADDGDGTVAGYIGAVANSVRALEGLPPTNAYVPGGCVTLGPLPELLPFNPMLSFSEHNVSWRGGLSYKLGDDGLIYGTASRGFKAGLYPEGLITSYTQYVPVHQEELTAYEVGLKENITDQFHVNLAAYYYDYLDKQVYGFGIDPLFGTTVRLVNIPKSRVVGVDLDAVWVPVEGLTLSGNASYVNSKVLEFDGINASGQQVNDAGGKFPYAPEWSASGDAEYSTGIGNGMNGFVGASLVYNSATNADPSYSADYYIKPYTVLDLRAGVEKPDSGWKGYVWVKNATDEYYWRATELGFDTVFRFTGMPRTYGVTLAYKF